MTDFFDTYVACSDLDALRLFLQSFVNVIQPQQGRAPVAATEETPAIPGAGDPSLWYSCVRATFDISSAVKSPLSVVDTETGSAVVGVWA